MMSYIRLVYSVWAKIYDSTIDPLFRFDRMRVIQALTPKKGEKILEIGVGTGLNLPHYPAFVRVTGIDISKDMLRKACQKKAKARVSTILMNAEELKFGENAFDKALATYTLRVTPHPKLVLQELSRVTKPNGLFVVLDQFRRGCFIRIFEPIQVVLGWGRDYTPEELIKGTPWKIQSRECFGKIKGTELIVLINKKV